MVKAVIIDDELMARASLRQDIQDYCSDITIIGEAQSVVSAIELIENKRPDLIFLDIQLIDGSGFDVIQALQHLEFKIIFTTAFSEYAIKAIKVSALDYLLKPIDTQELIEAIKKAKQSHLKHYKQKIGSLIHNGSNLFDQKIAIPSSEGIHIFDISDIIRCAAEGNYTVIYRKGNKKLLIAKTLKEITTMLEDFGFERVHKSHIINLDHLSSYINRDGGYVIMSDQTEIPVSQRRKPYLLNILSASNSK